MIPKSCRLFGQDHAAGQFLIADAGRALPDSIVDGDLDTPIGPRRTGQGLARLITDHAIGAETNAVMRMFGEENAWQGEWLAA
jgi:hypothetical protein